MGQAVAGCAGLVSRGGGPIDEDEASDNKPDTHTNTHTNQNANSSKPEQKPARLKRRLSIGPGLVDTKGPSLHSDQTYHDDDLSPSEQKAKGKKTCGVRTRQGFVPGNPGKVNQDRYVVRWNLKHKPVFLFGAFDGHGPQGHVISQFVASKLGPHLEAQDNLIDDPKAALQCAVAELCAHLEAEKKQQATYSGTTAVFSLMIDETLYTANIGDSRCVLCTRVGKSAMKPIPLSRDHKPELPDEKERIVKAGGRVHPLKGFYGGPIGPHRVWLGSEDIPGLAMSRSIGDSLVHTVGVSDIPEISEYKTHPLDKFVVWATDGVWDFISNEEVGRICAECAPDMDAAAALIVDKACRMWKKKEQVVDDITVVCLQLNDM
mmetsp:Transcript_12971/g.23535  ORF Transcript_12971/g.23535 Transcript_12971/m.23535 type:complete len:376 (-) Transcript_12971:261-1388(-)|eukprot:CAMPEP_0197541670 /NCGR_PEP_ID=MMETSP1318-20131121/67288_1 /TAXON_ID=552666 /ORGANISM="Partenskyella glossopodia, Strain RCC365" /LENGTH=375 /DNA_ID=CAMNT_0043100871 /DNA_START=650 /DNA_END=1777 /DNA_ORIENTATION=+